MLGEDLGVEGTPSPAPLGNKFTSDVVFSCPRFLVLQGLNGILP